MARRQAHARGLCRLKHDADRARWQLDARGVVDDALARSLDASDTSPWPCHLVTRHFGSARHTDYVLMPAAGSGVARGRALSLTS